MLHLMHKVCISHLKENNDWWCHFMSCLKYITVGCKMQLSFDQWYAWVLTLDFILYHELMVFCKISIKGVFVIRKTVCACCCFFFFFLTLWRYFACHSGICSVFINYLYNFHNLLYPLKLRSINTLLCILKK